MRRLVFPALLAWVALAAGAVLWSGWQLWGVATDNRAIRSLAGGSDVALREAADPRAAHARALFLALRDRPQEAEALLPALAAAPPGLRSEYHYAIGNARMRMGFERIERNRIDEATALVNLAKASYRETLRARPGNFDAKVNLDLAMRLVRDMPREGQDGDEDPENRPRRLWTDLPGLPRGAP
uniref:MxaK protein n=1 Tax=Paracoccus denitrificans TaxID=266 RepID=O54022_PARDE|nr:MxaK [Paracoccus denitrificans PD1222]